jgi:hypothetical protein
VSTAGTPGETPTFTVEVGGLGYVRFALDARRAGPQGVSIAFLDTIGKPQPMKSLVVTASAPDRATRDLSIQQTSSSVFHTTVELVRGNNVLVVTGNRPDGSPIRASLELTISPP